MKRILLLCICLYASLALAQIPGIYKYTRLDGYTAGVGFRVNQDEKGYLWIGTDNGGLRFDGRSFISLQSKHRAANAEILECLPLHHNKVAMVPLFGRLFFLEHDTLVYMDNNAKHKVQDTRWLNQYHYDMRSNTGWLWDVDALTDTKRTVYRFPANGGMEQAELPPGYMPLYIIGNHVICTYNISFYSAYDFGTRKMQRLYHADRTPLRYPGERLIHMDRTAGSVLVIDDKAKLTNVYNFTPGDSILEKVNSLKNTVEAPLFSSFTVPERQYATLGDAYRPKVILYYPDIRDTIALSLKIPDATASNCFVDKNSNLWITSTNNVLYFLSGNHIRNALAVQHIPLKEPLLKSITGTADQLIVSYPESKELTLLSGKKTMHITLNEQFKKGCRGMVMLNDSSLIVYDCDIAFVDTRRGTVQYSGFNEPFKSVCPFASGFVAGSSGGMSYIYRSSGGKYQIERMFRSRTVAVAAMDSTILFGSPSGMYTMQGLKGAPVKLQDSLVRNADISDIVLMDSSHALIATNGRGVLLYDKNGAISRPVPNGQNGQSLPLYIRKLHRSGPYTYWAATTEGAFCIRFTPAWQLESVKSYTFYDGLPADNVTSIFVRKDTAYVATTEGLGIIYVNDSTRTEMPVPLVYVNAVEVADLSFREPEKTIRLLHHQNDIRLQLSAISYESLGNVAYYYRLSPYQNEWIKTEEPDIRFSHLPPGHYRFEAYATNAKGGKSRIRVLQVVIQPAFWQTIYFKIIIAVLIIALMIAFISFQIRRIAQKRYRDMQQKKHLAELELEAIKAQINPHFIYNCLNSIQYLNYKEDYEQAQQYLNTFSRLIRKTMRYAQRVFISVGEEVEYLSSYLEMEQLRFKERLQYSITVDEALGKNTSLPAMLLQPYVENALKHGISGMKEGGRIEVSFLKMDRGLEITIKDNGPGFTSLKSQDALGLRLSGSRALSYNELFNINVTVACYNEQDVVPGQTGAVVKITITQTKNGTDND